MLMIRNLLLLLVLLTRLNVIAQVKYDEGAVYVQGLTFLQSSRDSTEYFYLPQFPRLATRQDGTFEFLCLQYVSNKAENSGGLIHALIEFSIPDSILKLYEIELRKIVPGAKIGGTVPLMESKSQGDENITPGFEVVSAIFNDKGSKDAMTRSVVTSGYAPFTPGSKAAVAGLLNPAGSTLLWKSFTGPTSDVSVSVNGYYEAVVRAYNAVVTANMSVIYKHLSQMSSQQQAYTKEQIRRSVDQLSKTGVIKVDAFDRSASLGVSVADMDKILGVITTRLIETMFDGQAGWSKDPERVDPNLGFNPKGRQGEKSGASQVMGETLGAVGELATDVIGALPVVGWFSSKNKKNTNPQYVTDNQFVLKDLKNIRTNDFYMNLSKTTTIKVPFHTAGNLGGLYAKLGEDERYFRIVNMEDPSFERKAINFQVDMDFFEAFDDFINFVTVNFRKKYSNGQSDVTGQLIFKGSDLKSGINLKEISYPRLGIKTSDWLDYEYQLLWSFKGKSDPIRFPVTENQWIKSNSPAISLSPPLVKEYVELDADRKEFLNNNIASASVSFVSVQGGTAKVIRTVILRADDKSSSNKIALYHDTGTRVAYQATWYSNKGEVKTDVTYITSNYLFLLTPSPEKFISR